jgi:3-dehydroquinate dehydratase-1
MENRYCLPLVKSDAKEVLRASAEALKNYAFVEVWLDYVEGADEALVKQLMESFPGKLVVVFRRENLEPMQMAEERRLALVRALAGSQALVDLDVDHQQAELGMIARDKLAVRVIGSYHNYDETPADERLYEIVAGIQLHEPEVVKVATLCQSEADSVQLLQLQLKLKAQGRKHIVLGMGAHGVVTRVFGSLWGNELIFAPESAAEATAPGELKRSQLDAIFGTLGAN